MSIGGVVVDKNIGIAMKKLALLWTLGNARQPYKNLVLVKSEIMYPPMFLLLKTLHVSTRVTLCNEVHQAPLF